MDNPPDLSVDLDPDVVTQFDEEFRKQKAAIPGKTRIIIEKISYKIKNDGLSLEEACLLVNVDMDWVEKAIVAHPVIPRIFAQKEVEFRVNLMRPLLKRAQTDDKMAQYLLELRMPKKKKDNGDKEEDDSMLAAAISFIQDNGDSTPLVRRESGKALVITKAGNAGGLIRKIKALLPGERMV